jgi:hypothetical protein
MFEPWRGANYESTRLLLLGESAYSWEEDAHIIDPSPHHPVEIVRHIVDDFDYGGLGFMRTLTRGLANEEWPSKERCELVWNKVAFTNYVPGTVGHKARVRPSPDKWKQAKLEFPDLLEQLKPLRLIVLGLEMWDDDHMPPASVGGGSGAQAYRLSSGELCWCLPLAHPSAHGSKRTSWRQLAAAVYFHYADQFKHLGAAHCASPMC